MKIFGTREDPFYKWNKEKNEHKIKIKLIPPANLKQNDFEDRKITDPYADLSQYIEEQS